MQALYLEIKNLIISTLNLDELTPEVAMVWVSTPSMLSNLAWP